MMELMISDTQILRTMNLSKIDVNPMLKCFVRFR